MWHDLLLFAAVGFAAQLVDGAIGMAYGVTGTTVMLSLGVAPATASASIRAAEVFTCAISGLSHWRFGNVRWSLLWRLALPGMLGGAAGAHLLSVRPGEAIRPYPGFPMWSSRSGLSVAQSRWAPNRGRVWQTPSYRCHRIEW